MTKKNQLAAMFGAAAMIAGVSDQFPEEARAFRRSENRNDFQKFHDELRARPGQRRLFYRGAKPYVKPIVPGIVKGKLARKAAKKQRMAELRATQGF